MNISEIINSKTLKPKEKTETICKWILEESLTIDDLIGFANASKDPGKATCIESLEFATRMNPKIATKGCLDFVSGTLKEKAPRIKWESAKVIGNIAKLFQEDLDYAITNLLTNSEHTGTVVRWSSAFALGEILKLNTKYNTSLLPAIESICNAEEKNSIRKIYSDALKKTKKL